MFSIADVGLMIALNSCAFVCAGAGDAMHGEMGCTSRGDDGAATAIDPADSCARERISAGSSDAGVDTTPAEVDGGELDTSAASSCFTGGADADAEHASAEDKIFGEGLGETC